MTDSSDTFQRNGQRLVAFYDRPRNSSGDTRGVDLLPIADAQRYVLQGPAVSRLVYITHPSSEQRLVPFADYDEQLARDKLNEALRVVNCLGASHVIAKAMKGSVTSARGGAGASIGSLTIGGEKSARWDVAYEQDGTGGRAADPRPLMYPDEPGFEAACVAVLNNGASSVKIEIIRQSQFSVESELAAGLKKAGFQLGVTAEKNRYSVFVIEARFGPLAELPPDLGAVGEPLGHATSSWRRGRK